MYNLYIKKTQKHITDSFYISFLQKSNNPALFEVYLKDSDKLARNIKFTWIFFTASTENLRGIPQIYCILSKSTRSLLHSDLVFYLYDPIKELH